MDPTKPSPPPTKPPPPIGDRDILNHLETYLSKRDGVDKLLKISRYAAKLLLSTTATAASPLSLRLKSFESSVGLSRKAFRLGKFVQDLNTLRNSDLNHTNTPLLLLHVIAYGGEGLYYFIEQFVWLSKTGLITNRYSNSLGKISAWAELIGYFGSISLKIIELREIEKEEMCVGSIIEVSVTRGEKCEEMRLKMGKLTEKKLLKRLSIVQDFADGLMALADVRDGRGRLSGPVLLSSAGLLSALISTHKNWNSC